MRKILQNKKEANRGITLIALIITIIVLLILAGVAIATLTGENGILTQAKNAKKEMTKAEAKERIQLEVLGSYGTDGEIDIATLKANIAKNIPEAVIGEETELPLTVTVGDYTFTVKANGTVEEATPTTVEEAVVGEIVTRENKPYTKNGKAIIPVGFAIVPGLDDVSEGLVISDVANDEENTGNQFVWIPVTEENPFERRAGFHNGSLQDMDEYKELNSNGEYENSSNSGSATGSEIATASEDTTASESAITQAEAISMYASVEENGGFYIGRYEAGKNSSGNVVCKKGETAYNLIHWGINEKYETAGALELSRNFAEENDYDTTKVHSTLCYGVQWDTALKFIDPGYTGYAKDSSKMGWFSNNARSTSTGNTETNEEYIAGKDLIYTSDVGSIPAGEPTNKHKNIYDMAGNVHEWTMESGDFYGVMGRVVRGYDSQIYYSDKILSASYRDAWGVEQRDKGFGFRIALYL